MGTTRRIVLPALIGVLLVVSSVCAEEPSSAGSVWRFELTPYLWLASISGEVGVRQAPSVAFDADVSDILKNVDFGAMVSFEAWRSPWRILLDGMYTSLSKRGDPPGPAFSAVDVSEKIGIVTSALGYRLWDGPFGSFDALVGARIWVVENELRFRGDVLPSRTLGQTKSWADPVLGARWRTTLWEKWFAVLFGDVGGFGAGSDLTWQAFGGIGYQFNDRWSLKVGYRALAVDFERQGFTLDIIQHGPQIGLGFRF